MNNDKDNVIYQLKGMPKIKEAIPLALQHVAAMIVGCVTPAIIVAGTGGLSPADTRILIQAALIISGIATLIQLFPPFRKVGSGLPVIMGVSFAYLPTMIGIVSDYNIATILGSQVIGGVVGILIGIFIKKLRKLFPPVVTGTVVFTIGLSLYPTAIKYMAGGAGNENFGSPMNWIIAMTTLVLVIFFNNFTKGFARLASILLSMIIGYVIALFCGMIDFGTVQEASWFMLPAVGHFGYEFHLPAIISMSILFVVNSVESIGQFSALSVGAMDREPTTDELSRGLMGNGVSSIIGSIFGGLPTSTFGQNVGIVVTNRVINRVVIGFAAGFIVLAGLFPKFSALMMTIPYCVLGGATISVFATITMTGVKLFMQSELTQRNATIVGLSVALGIGISQVPGAMEQLPAWIDSLFGESAVVVSTLSAILLNLILPKNTPFENEDL